MSRDTVNFWRYDTKAGQPIPVILHKGTPEVVDDGGETEEGYSRSQTTYSFDGEIVTRETEGVAKDCDGRTEYYSKRQCTIDNLHAEKSSEWNLYFPKWEPTRR